MGIKQRKFKEKIDDYIKRWNFIKYYTSSSCGNYIQINFSKINWMSMKEFKLIPLNETNISAAEPHSKVSQLKNMVETRKLDGDDFKDLIKNFLMNEKTDDHFKLILL